MKLRKELGSEAVQDVIREASARAAAWPHVDLHDPWPSDRALLVPATPAKKESTQDDK
jgi:hypothetical protein